LAGWRRKVPSKAVAVREEASGAPMALNKGGPPVTSPVNKREKKRKRWRERIKSKSRRLFAAIREFVFPASSS